MQYSMVQGQVCEFCSGPPDQGPTCRGFPFETEVNSQHLFWGVCPSTREWGCRDQLLAWRVMGWDCAAPPRPLGLGDGLGEEGPEKQGRKFQKMGVSGVAARAFRQKHPEQPWPLPSSFRDPWCHHSWGTHRDITPGLYSQRSTAPGNPPKEIKSPAPGPWAPVRLG